MRLEGFVVTVSISCCICFSWLKAEDWPNWRGPNYDGLSLEKIPEPLPESFPIAWRTQVGIGFCTVSVVGDRVVTMGNVDDRDTVWCIRAEDGELLWRFDYSCELDPLYYEGGPSATPTIVGNSVFTLSKKGHAFCLDLATGQVIWKRDLVAEHGFALPEWSFASSPVIAGDRVLLNVGREGLALDRKSGETVWKGSTETSGYSSAVPLSRGADDNYLFFSAKSLFSFSSKSGEILWQVAKKASRDVNAADPVVRGNRVLVSSSSGSELLQIRPDQKSVQQIWKEPDLKWYFNPGVLIGDHVYSLHGTTHRPTELVCHRFDDGQLAWSEDGFGSGAMMAANDILVLFDQGKLTLFRANPSRFEKLLEQQLLDGKCWTVPVLANGRIYCRNAEGELVSVRVR